MESEKYKKQFIEFLKTIYPKDLPSDVCAIGLSNSSNGKQFRFVFDPEDYKGESKKKKDYFTEHLTKSDLVFLKKFKVGIED